MKAIYDAVIAFVTWIWGIPILVILLGGGIWLTIATGFVQFRHFGFILKNTIGKGFGTKADGSKVSSFQATATALSAVLGTGNIVGVGTAIATGGPGAIFWMWIVGMVAMCLKYSEALLSVEVRTTDEHGRIKGGAHYYLGKIWKPMGILWAICMIYGLLTAAGVHTGSVVTACNSLGVPRMVATVIICVIIAVVMYGGLKMVVQITERLIPIMAGIYILAGLVVIIMNINNLLPALSSIFAGAFSGTAAIGGFTGAAVSAAIRNGVARGVYSSDAGNGQSSLIYARADVENPVDQAVWGAFEVFFDTIIVCTFTALVILTTGVWQSGDQGSVLAINAFSSALGTVGNVIASIGLILFAGSTILAFCTFLGLLVEDIFGHTVAMICQVVFIILAFVGGTIGVDIMLLWADLGNAFTITINVIGMLIMTKTIHKLTKDYFSKKS